VSYRRSTGTRRGEARRQELLERITDDLATHGLVDFSLRRAARAAGTTHKVLLYHFDGVDDLLEQAIVRLRERRIGNAVAVLRPGSLGDGVRAIWAVLHADESGLRVLDQAIGLTLYDPDRYGALGREASQQYMPTLLAMCPDHWSEGRKVEVASMIMAALRGFLVDWLTTGDAAGATAGLEALVRALDREEAAGS
jgi:AcrR family transcriptional regulator